MRERARTRERVRHGMQEHHTQRHAVLVYEHTPTETRREREHRVMVRDRGKSEHEHTQQSSHVQV